MYDVNSPFKYENWLNSAFLEVVKKILYTVEKVGIYKNIHFFITFKTNKGDVKLPHYLKEQYPKTMTIVLQKQFYNLKTYDNGFSVILYFNSKAEELFIPWSNITLLLDPDTPFSLKIIPSVDSQSPDPKGKIIKFPKQHD